MDKTINLSPLHPYLITKNDVNKMTRLIGEIADGLFKEGIDLSELLAQEAPYGLNQVFEKMAKELGVDITDKSALQSFFMELQKEVSTLPVVHIILAIKPKEKLIKVIHAWLFQNFQKCMLLDINVDPHLIAGGVISFNGRANDYSLSSKLEQIQQ